MLGQLPKQLEVDGEMYDIRTDYRECLLIFQAFNDPDLTKEEKQIIMLSILYRKVPENTSEALKQAVWFLNCGQEQEESHDSKRLYDWEQDEQMIFSAINNVAGHEVRADEYMHFWTFIGLFHCIGESLLSTVINIRDKINKGKELDKVDEEFYSRNQKLVKLKPRRSKREQEHYDWINKMNS